MTMTLLTSTESMSESEDEYSRSCFIGNKTQPHECVISIRRNEKNKRTRNNYLCVYPISQCSSHIHLLMYKVMASRRHRSLASSRINQCFIEIEFDLYI